jgi:hypothetical protein
LEDPYHRMKIGDAANLTPIDVALFNEWLELCERAALATDGLVYARRGVVFGFRPAGMVALRLSHSLPINTAASRSALAYFVDELKGRVIGDAALADGAAVVCGDGFATQMALAFDPCPTVAYEMASRALSAREIAAPAARVGGGELRSAVARIGVILGGFGLDDDRVTVTTGLSWLRLSHDYAAETLPASVSTPMTWVSSIRALATVGATVSDRFELSPFEAAGSNRAVLIRSPDRREAVVVPIRQDQKR